MGSRNAVEIYDPALARQQQRLAEPHKYASAPPPPGGFKPIQLSADVQQKIANALAKEGAKLRQREEERRKRDPKYRPDAIELSNANLLEFDKYVDYYEKLGVDSFASSGEIKAAYKKLSLELHPDKQKDKPDNERKMAKEKFLDMVHAHTILSDLATRRAYDNERDSMDARNESGLQDVGKFEKPPPTCVDVEVSLEQLYRGTRKQVHFTRNEFAGTRWAKKTYDDFSVKVNRGELEGATIWHRNLGDCGPFGRSDLVFVVKQEPHAVFERLGDDLWYYDRTPIAAEQLFYCGWAPTLGRTKSDEKLHEKYNGQYRRVAAFGSTLYALLGFDRSGLGEALVPGHGMPLRPNAEEDRLNPDRTMGDLIIKFPVELPQDRRAAPPRVHLAVGGSMPLPPICLLTPEASSGLLPPSALRVLLVHSVVPAVLQRVARQKLLHAASAARSGGNARSGGGDVSYPPPLPGDEDEPLFACAPSPSAMPPVHAMPNAPTQLVGVVLLVGGSIGDAGLNGNDVNGADASSKAVAPSEATRGLMAACSSALPALQWHVLRMHAQVSEPLLADEMEMVEHATLLVLEALPDAPDPGSQHASETHASEAVDVSGSAEGDSLASATASPPGRAAQLVAAATASLPPAADAATSSEQLDAEVEGWERVAGWGHVQEWSVAYAPGMRARARPSTSSAVVGKPLRAGERVQGSLVPGISRGEADYWVRFEHGVGADRGSRYVRCAGRTAGVFVRPMREVMEEAARGRGGAGVAERPWQVDSKESKASQKAVGAASAVAGPGGDAETRPADAADETAEVKLEVSKRDRDEQAVADAEQAEDASWMADVAGRRDAAVDEAYLESGCASAAALMRHPSARCVHRCHCAGGIVLAVGRGCSLLGHAGRRKYRAAVSDETDGGPVVTLSMADLEAIREEFMADDIPIAFGKMCTWSRAKARAYFDNNGVLPAQFAGPTTPLSSSTAGATPGIAASGGTRAGLFLPFLVGCAPAPRSAADMDGWRRLRAAAVRSKLEDTKHGFSALGLPSGSVLTVLTTHRFAMRSVLGSAQPLKLSVRKLAEVAARRDIRVAKLKLDAAREAKLEEIWSCIAAGERAGDEGAKTAAMQAAIREANARGSERDESGALRGPCGGCGTCPCYVRPRLPGGFWEHSGLRQFCASCGCATLDHEEVKRQQPPASTHNHRRRGFESIYGGV